jgi:mono/diheme cytochrome c family protein
VQPEWPLPFRFAAETPLFTFLAIAAITFIGGIFVFVGRLRIPRSLALTGGAIAAMVLALSLRGAAVPAYPTTYVMSPTGYTAASIVQGEALFQKNCVACHAPGSAALAAEQLDARPDGDLFWFISHGLAGMPAFGALDATAVWNLIDYVHAAADVARLSTTGVRAPDMAADCPDGSTLSLADLRGRIVHLIVGVAPPPERAQALTALAPDVVSILVLGDNAADGPLCTIRDDSALAALAIVSGRRQGESEFLIDQNGSIRALWFPGVVPAWTDTAVLLRSVAAIRANTSISQAPMPAHMHMH